MTIQENIKEFQDLLESQLRQHDAFLDHWDSSDWHQRTSILQVLLHGMWQVFDEAEDKADVLSSTFPPYPFDEVKEIKKWIKKARHRLNGFLEEEYVDQMNDDYLTSFGNFLHKLSEDNLSDKWTNNEMVVAKGEKELLDMLNKSYSVLLELLMHIEDNASTPEFVLLSYHNSQERYNQLNWTNEQRIFENYITNSFPWVEVPSEQQLQECYQELYKEYSETVCGRLRLLYPDDSDFVMALAKQNISDKELKNFYLYEKKIEYLNERIRIAHASELEALKQLRKKEGKTTVTHKSSSPPTPFTITYKGDLDTQKRSDRLSFVRRVIEKLGWFEPIQDADDFEHLFSGLHRECNIRWSESINIATAYYFLQQLLEQNYITRETGCTARSLMLNQFHVPNARADASRVTNHNKECIRRILFMLDPTHPIPTSKRNLEDNDLDIMNETYWNMYQDHLNIRKGV